MTMFKSGGDLILNPKDRKPGRSNAGAWCLGLLALTALCAGCAATAVKPWDRDLLAEQKMRFVPLPMENAVDEHVYFSKEGSTGGQGVGGGGCGCN